jgi:hypothetical protein
MRILPLIALVFVAAVASAQEALPPSPCGEKPTQSCVLDMAVDASRASGLPDGSLPYGPIVETAARSGRLDFALGLADRLDVSDTLAVATAALVEAFARADRLEDLRPFLQGRGETEDTYYRVIVPALIEQGRDAEAADRLAKIKPPPLAEDVAYFYAFGHLSAGRAGEAIKSLEAIGNASKREKTVAYLSQGLIDSGRPEAAGPLLPLLSANNSFALSWRARLVQALGDIELARSALKSLGELKGGDRLRASTEVAYALARAGAWEEAFELARSIHESERAFVLANVAILSRQPGTFAQVMLAIDEESDPEVQNRLERLFIKALMLAGVVPMARTYVDYADNLEERELRFGMGAAALAARGQGLEALKWADAISDPKCKAWVLWEVASELKE